MVNRWLVMQLLILGNLVTIEQQINKDVLNNAKLIVKHIFFENLLLDFTYVQHISNYL